MTIKSSTPGTGLNAEGGREFRWVWVILLVIIFWPGAILYYFTRKENSISVSIFPKQTGCTINASSNGKRGDEVLNMLSAAVR